MFKNIVSGTDGHRGRSAASLSQLIATAAGARLLLVGVEWDPPLPLESSTTTRADLEAELRDVRDELARDALIQVAYGLSAAQVLRRVADDEHADLIVVGSHHREHRQRLASGAVTMQVFHDAPCAVAIAPDHVAPCRALTRIGVGIDDAPESAAALDTALELAEHSGAELHMLAVASNVYSGSPALPMGTASLDSYRAILDARAYTARAALDTALARCDGLPVTGTVRMGDPAAELIDLSADCDLLVLGSRRWGTVLRLALGSTSEAVIRKARCPVLVPPRGVAKEQREAQRAAHENIVF